ncbi:hypothetical protein E2986_07394 [Frieseomelitta varia]|uniref:RETREG1-3/ARL6IP-like N-terminal reticulon-homology domain-containing protein n=1 Tax=Frieseomelitta varia TaxID=561572 RepID=A0A833S258_9HYME|nr:hypothetical protein E2986_07394 [Frieseomelitta varia]
MERLSRVACYFRWMRNTLPHDASKAEDERKTVENERHRNVGCSFEASRRLCGILESILLWENSVNSISVVIVFNILFCSYAKAEQIEKIGKRIKSVIHSLKQLRKEQPGVFCTAVCSLSLGLWIIGRTINGILLIYTICMSILLGPALLLKLPSKMVVHKEWDSEIEEFLPAVTEDNLQVLTRAGESGDQSPTPTSVLSDAQNEFLIDEDLLGLKMPSHEDGSTDGVEVSELELSAEETDVDGIKFQSGHFEKGSSSEEEAELEPLSSKLVSHSDESGSEFEIIDGQEIDNLDIA